jgi:hypothetical protein
VERGDPGEFPVYWGAMLLLLFAVVYMFRLLALALMLALRGVPAAYLGSGRPPPGRSLAGSQLPI